MGMRSIFLKYYQKIESSSFLTILIAVSVTSIFYLIQIFRFPGYFGDDFYLFYKIQSNPHQLISTDSHELLYLFYRPVYYLYFWMLVQCVGNNAIVLKLISVCLAELYVLILFLAGRYLLNICYNRSSNFMLLLTTLAVAFHHDTVFSIVWLSDINEIMMCLWYSLAIFMILLFISGTLKSRRIFFVLITIFYVLSVLTKQQSLHLPVLLLFILIIFKNSLEQEKRSFLLVVSFFLTALMIAVAIPNLHLFYQGDNSMYETVHYGKKIFAVLGNILLILVPYGGTAVYNSILQNKIFVLVPTILLIVGLYYGIHSHKVTLRNLLYMCVGGAIIFFPRISLPTSDRINTLQVCILWLFFMVIFFEKKKIFYYITAVFMINSIMSAFSVTETLNAESSMRNEMHRGLARLCAQNNEMKFIVSETTTINQYTYYYYTHNAFGMDTAIIGPAVICRSIQPIMPEMLEHHFHGDTLTITCLSNDRYLEVKKEYSPFVVGMVPSTMRKYSQVSILFPNTYFNDRTMWIYYSDKEWVRIR
jgi:hypothetical protein